jgi:hypothetical protein
MLMAEFTTPARTYGSRFTSSIFCVVARATLRTSVGVLPSFAYALATRIFMSCAASWSAGANCGFAVVASATAMTRARISGAICGSVWRAAR